MPQIYPAFNGNASEFIHAVLFINFNHFIYAFWSKPEIQDLFTENS